MITAQVVLIIPLALFVLSIALTTFGGDERSRVVARLANWWGPSLVFFAAAFAGLGYIAAIHLIDREWQVWLLSAAISVFALRNVRIVR